MTPTRIPIGPQHPLLKEPLSINLSVSGETVLGADLRIGYVHRGIEKLAQQRTYIQNVHLVERVCGICSQAHTTTFCLSVEKLAGIEVPRRAQYIRMLLCELERIHSHLLWLGVLSEAIGFTTIFMYAWRDREIILDLMEDLSGGRVSHSATSIGGVRIDLTPDHERYVQTNLAEFEEQLKLFRDMVLHDRNFQARTRRLGVMGGDLVHRLGLVGPTARASGCTLDIRKQQPYLAYEEMDFQVITGTGGDVWCRAHTRLAEIDESLKIVHQILDGLPEGEIQVRAPRRVPAGEVTTRIEAPRGELFYYVRSDGSDTPVRVKVRTPTLPTLASLPHLLSGVQTADVSAVIAGADLCIACADR